MACELEIATPLPARGPSGSRCPPSWTAEHGARPRRDDLVGGFALDEVTDLLLALDEVATALMLVAKPDSLLDCSFTGGDGALRARVSALAREPAALDEQSFGWHVVATLTDALRTDYAGFDAARDGYPTTVEFGWIRRLHGPTKS